MKLLLHICCAPCSIYTVEELSKNPSDKITGFYFNPNIYPADEYSRRRSAVEEYTKMLNRMFEIIFPEYDPEEFFRKINYNEARPARCRICWQMRLEETAAFAAANKFDSFSTTLLISPYQDHLVIKAMGEELAKKFNIDFYYADFRTGFRKSQEEARGQNLYRQKYCGCRYSEMERLSKKPSLDNVRD